MSHIVTIQTRVTDPLALAAACRRLKLEPPVHGTAQLYAGGAKGLVVKLPGWHYPVVAETATGTLRFDNYGGAWGARSELDRLLQAYAVEKARLEARRAGHGVTEQQLPGGAIKLTVHVGTGGAA